ncbi:serine palmitoyltransferase small subunit A [Frankliniella occidentalis]|uniref:Serine palmitoyltransferase small subunit B n=1 Tax=Frankliniella occidentalis TaxID=133901 RepID=A0A6J1S2A0_FRAOC|nr:serine palmitoyltransferase small subunit A [Frankliniella occidentalis]
MLDYIKKKIAWLVLQYELITCLNMFEPWEQMCLNATVLLVVSLVSYSSYVYLPHYIMSLINSAWSVVSSGEERVEYRFESG